MNKSLLVALACTALLPLDVRAQTASTSTVAFQAVPELSYKVVTFF